MEADDIRAPARVTVVIATRNRCNELLAVLDRMSGQRDVEEVIVVDNASTDGTPDAVRKRHPLVRVVAADRNLGAPARNVGAEMARTPYVAFADDDSWWPPGALHHAAVTFDAYPRLGLLQARILVGADEREDPTCAEMAASPLPASDDLPGPALLGFVACGAVVRRDAMLSVGGFDDLLFFVGEESLLAQDLAAAGWGLSYAEGIVAHHHPSEARDPAGRRRLEVRNTVVSAWMRRRLRTALHRTLDLVVAALRDPVARTAAAEAMRCLPEAVRRRRRLPSSVEHEMRLLESTPVLAAQET
jgi:GT2 family glycosyltransferase